MRDNGAKYVMDRRRFLELAGLTAAALAVDGCAPKATPVPTPTEAPAPTPTTAPAPTPTPTTGVELESEINVLNWGAYIDHGIEPFEEKFNCKVNIDYYASEDEAISKIQAAGFGVYDTVNLGVGYLKPVVKMGLLEPLDISRIPNYELLYEEFKPGPFEVDGQIWGVDYGWGVNGLMYNSELSPYEVDSWAAFWDPQFEGWTSLIDKPKDQYLVCMLYLGLDFNNPSLDDWPDVVQAMKDRVKLMKALWPSEDTIMRYMINKEIWLADMYDGLGRQIEAEYATCKFVAPEEGTYGWFDGPLMVKGAPHPNLTYEWINHLISPEMAKLEAELVMYAPGNSLVPDMIDPELRKALYLDDPHQMLKGIKFWEDLGPEWTRRIGDAWTEAKAAA